MKNLMISAVLLAGLISVAGCGSSDTDSATELDTLSQSSALGGGQTGIGFGSNCAEACAFAEDDLANQCGGYAEAELEHCALFSDNQRYLCKSQGSCVYPAE